MFSLFKKATLFLTRSARNIANTIAEKAILFGQWLFYSRKKTVSEPAILETMGNISKQLHRIEKDFDNITSRDEKFNHLAVLLAVKENCNKIKYILEKQIKNNSSKNEVEHKEINSKLDAIAKKMEMLNPSIRNKKDSDDPDKPRRRETLASLFASAELHELKEVTTKLRNDIQNKS